MLVTDLDGTLVRGRHVDPADVEALRRWREAGHLLVIATGRSVMLARLAARDAMEAAGGVFDCDYDYVICASGTTLLDRIGQVLRCDPLPPDQVSRAATFLAGRQDCAVIATTLDGDFLLHNPFGPQDEFARYAALFTPATLEEVLTKDVTSMPVHVPDAAVADALAAELVARSGGAVGTPRSVQYLDVVPAGQDKGAAIVHLREALAGRGVSVDRVAAVGDSWNDIPMYRHADVPAAMADGTQDAQEAALAAGGLVVDSLADLVDVLLAR